MHDQLSHITSAAMGLLGVAAFVAGWALVSPAAVACGAAGCCWLVWRAAWVAWGRVPGEAAPVTTEFHKPAPRPPVDPNDSAALVRRMLEQQRFALLLRPKIAANLSDSQWAEALAMLKRHMALVPGGEVVLGPNGAAEEETSLDECPAEPRPPRICVVRPCFIDRYPVTNRQFYEFVAAGGYEQMALWDPSVLPAVLDFVDRSGRPGPRFWKDGCYLPGEENLPVVGVSWYEAAAFARWVGKRLPSDAEWVKAGAWPVALGANRLQRKYPWGDTMERHRANLWGSGPGRIVAVDEFAEGVSVGGVYQLIGNVWEWTSGTYKPSDHPSGDLLLNVPLRNIRGGAFDTYFDAQASCDFHSGENPLGRKHNIGFRCAIGVCDLALRRVEVGESGIVPEVEGRCGAAAAASAAPELPTETAA